MGSDQRDNQRRNNTTANGLVASPARNVATGADARENAAKRAQAQAVKEQELMSFFSQDQDKGAKLVAMYQQTLQDLNSPNKEVRQNAQANQSMQLQAMQSIRTAVGDDPSKIPDEITRQANMPATSAWMSGWQGIVRNAAIVGTIAVGGAALSGGSSGGSAVVGGEAAGASQGVAAGGGLTATQAAATPALAGGAGAGQGLSAATLGGATGATGATAAAPAAAAATPAAAAPAAATATTGGLGTQLGNAAIGSLVNAGVNALHPKPSEAPTNSANTAATISAEQWDLYKKNYLPVEQQWIADAKKAGSPEEYAAAAGRATADVTSSFDKAAKQNDARMQAYGINPGSANYQSSAGSLGLAQGAAQAGALTSAYNAQNEKAYSRMSDVVKTGRGIPSDANKGSIGASYAQGAAQTGYANQNSANANATSQTLAPFANALTNAGQSWYSTASFADGGKIRTAAGNADQRDNRARLPGLYGINNANRSAAVVTQPVGAMPAVQTQPSINHFGQQIPAGRVGINQPVMGSGKAVVDQQTNPNINHFGQQMPVANAVGVANPNPSQQILPAVDHLGQPTGATEQAAVQTQPNINHFGQPITPGQSVGMSGQGQPVGVMPGQIGAQGLASGMPTVNINQPIANTDKGMAMPVPNINHFGQQPVIQNQAGLMQNAGQQPMSAATVQQPANTVAQNWYSTSSFAKGGKVITPHHKPMKMCMADGGNVAESNQPLEGPGTETSDSIPAQIDGNKPAALSDGEFVMSAPVLKMSGEEILKAINNAGLEKRQGYADGGEIKAKDAPIGSGTAKKSASTIDARKAYEEKKIEAQMNGEDLPPFEQWIVASGYRNGGRIYSNAGL